MSNAWRSVWLLMLITMTARSALGANGFGLVFTTRPAEPATEISLRVPAGQNELTAELFVRQTPTATAALSGIKFHAQLFQGQSPTGKASVVPSVNQAGSAGPSMIALTRTPMTLSAAARNHILFGTRKI